jgi:hypothetical protein
MYFKEAEKLGGKYPVALRMNMTDPWETYTWKKQ